MLSLWAICLSIPTRPLPAMGTSRDSGSHLSRSGRYPLPAVPWRHRPPVVARDWIAATSAEPEATVGWVRDTDAPTAFTVERIGASSDEPIINVPQTRAAANSFGYLVELEILPLLGTLANAISATATSIVFTAESTEDIAIGDELRIESEVVTVDAVPADGATGAAARTYGITRGSDAATHTNTRAVQKNAYELESDGIILQGGPSPQQGGSTSRSTVSLGTGGLVDATGIRELGVRLTSTRSTTGLSGLEQTRLIDLISQGDNAVLLPSTRITVYLAVIGAGRAVRPAITRR